MMVRTYALSTDLIRGVRARAVAAGWPARGVQRYTDALTLYPHFHVITTDGLLVASDGPLKPRASVDEAHFLPAPYLDLEDLIDILILYEHRLTRRFIRRGYLRPITPGLPASEQSFTLHWGHEAPSEEESQLLKCYAASAKLRHAFGPRAGQPLELHMEDALAGSAWDTPLCVSHSGFNLHANTVVEASDRDRLGPALSLYPAPCDRPRSARGARGWSGLL